MPGSPDAAGRAASLLEAFRRGRGPVVHVQHIAMKPGSRFFPARHGGRLDPRPGPPGRGRTGGGQALPNAFRDTELLDLLRRRGAGRLVLAGMMTHMCIDATTRAAFDLGFECMVAADACAAPALTLGGVQVPAEQVHAAFLAALSGSYAKVVPTAEL